MATRTEIAFYSPSGTMVKVVTDILNFTYVTNGIRVTTAHGIVEWGGPYLIENLG